MRITEVVSTFPPYFGGMGNACLRMSEELMNLGNQVVVYTSLYPKKDYQYPDGLKVNRLKYQLRHGNAMLTIGLFKIKDTDIIHLHYPNYFGAEIIYIVSKIRKIPYVVTYHMDMRGTGIKKYIFRLHKKLFLKLIMEGASRIYVSSSDYAKYSDLSEIKSIQKKINEVALGVDLYRFQPTTQDTDLRKKLHILANEQVIMFIGQLDKPHYFKGVPVLLDAFAKLNNEKVKLVLIGEGDLRKSFELKVKELKIENNVVFTGRVEDEVLNNYLSIANFIVLPSTDKTEAFGMVTLEAMASGKPVIVSDLPGVRTLVEFNRNGLLVEPGNLNALTDVMNQLLNSKSLQSKFGLCGRRIAETKYSWERIGEQLYRSFEQIVGNKPSAINTLDKIYDKIKGEL